MRFVLLSLALGMLVSTHGCGPSAKPQPDQPPAPEPAPPVLEEELEVEPTYGEPMTVHGVLEADRIPGGKMFQGMWLQADGGGGRYVLSYRPQERWFPYVDKRVVVSGRPYRPGRHTQHILADHFDVDAIALADGETPWDPVPTALPAPVTVANVAALKAERPGAWVRLVGTLEAIVPQEGAHWPAATVKLDDGHVVTVQHVREDRWRPLLGQAVSVVGQRSPAIDLVNGPTAVCAGDVARCGMDFE